MSRSNDIVDRIGSLLGESSSQAELALSEAEALIADKVESLERFELSLTEDAGFDEDALAALIESDYDALDSLLSIFGFELSEETLCQECEGDKECEDCKKCQGKEKKESISESRDAEPVHLDSLRREFKNEAEQAAERVLKNAFNFHLYNDASSAARQMIAAFDTKLLGVMNDAIEALEDLDGSQERVHRQVSYEYARSMLDFCNHLREMYEDAANQTESGSDDGWSDSEREGVVREYEDAIRVIEREMSPYHPAHNYRLL